MPAPNAWQGWYNRLRKAPWTPPMGAFGAIWAVLYTLMAVAFYKVWTNKKCYPYCAGVGWFLLQLLLNVVWTTIFFRFKSPGWALVDIVAMVTAAAYAYDGFSAIDNAAGQLLLPYLAWLLVAFSLNLYIVVMN